MNNFTETMTAFADAIRTLTGSTEKMSIADMTAHVNQTNETISEISTALGIVNNEENTIDLSKILDTVNNKTNVATVTYNSNVGHNSNTIYYLTDNGELKHTTGIDGTAIITCLYPTLILVKKQEIFNTSGNIIYVADIDEYCMLQITGDCTITNHIHMEHSGGSDD